MPGKNNGLLSPEKKSGRPVPGPENFRGRSRSKGGRPKLPKGEHRVQRTVTLHPTILELLERELSLVPHKTGSEIIQEALFNRYTGFGWVRMKDHLMNNRIQTTSATPPANKKGTKKSKNKVRRSH